MRPTYPDDTNRTKFVRLAENRTNKAIAAIHTIGRLATPTKLDYTEEDITKIFEALQAELDEARSKFTRTESPRARKFSLSD